MAIAPIDILIPAKGNIWVGEKLSAHSMAMFEKPDTHDMLSLVYLKLFLVCLASNA